MAEETKLFFANFSDVYVDEVQELFESCGEVVRFFIKYDDETSACAGWGIVEMGSREEAEEAVRRLNGRRLTDSEWRLKVGFARPKITH